MKFPEIVSDKKEVQGLMAKKKKEKKNAIVNSAFHLFVSKGISKTSIDDIVKGAGLAKGTFYLYFKDKDALLDEMVYSLCFEAVGDALTALNRETEDRGKMEIGDGVCLFAEKLLENFMENKELLPIIHKNLFRGLYSDRKNDGSPLNVRCENSIIENVVNDFTSQFMILGGTVEEATKRLYFIVELVNAIAYNSIIEGIPYSFSEVKPLLLKTIRCLAYPQFN